MSSLVIEPSKCELSGKIEMDEIGTGENGARTVFQAKEVRADAGSANGIVEAEVKARDEKTARLRAARLARAVNS